MMTDVSNDGGPIGVGVDASQQRCAKRLRDLQRVQRDGSPELPPSVVQRQDGQYAGEADDDGGGDVGPVRPVDGARLRAGVRHRLRPAGRGVGYLGFVVVVKDLGTVRHGGGRERRAEGDLAHTVEHVLLE